MPAVLAPISNAADASAYTATRTAETLLTDEEFAKLKERVKNSYGQLEPQRKARLKTLKQFIGNSLGATGDGDLPRGGVVNMLDQMVEVYMQQLVSGNPQCIVVTNKLALKANARYFQLALNHVLKQIDLRESLKFGVLESLFSMMVMKVGVENPDYTDRNYPFDVSAMPFAEPVWFEDWVHDTSVNRLELCRFYGDKYKEHKDVILADPRNDQDVVSNIDSGPMGAYDSGGGSESADDLHGKQNSFESDKDDMISLWDIYLPRKKLIVTFPVNGGDKPLRVTKWTGPPRGPYKVGRYKLVLNQIMPKPPAVDGAPLADLDNRLFEKLGEQASRQKVLTFASLQGVKDAQTVIHASDGEVVNVVHPDSVRQASFGGVDQGTATFEQMVKARASYEWGNLDTMGGLGTGADTLGQEQILQQASSGRIRMMQAVVIELTKQVIIDIGWYLWNDPLVRISVTDKIPGTDVEMEIQWPQQVDEFGNQSDLRQGEYNDLNFEVIPFSMQDMAPQTRAAQLRSIFQQDVMPAMPLLQQEQITINMDAYLKTLGSYLGMSAELSDIIHAANSPPDPDQEVANMQPGKPNSTTRQYERVVKPKGEGAGGAPAMVASMPAARPNGTTPGGVR